MCVNGREPNVKGNLRNDRTRPAHLSPRLVLSPNLSSFPRVELLSCEDPPLRRLKWSEVERIFSFHQLAIGEFSPLSSGAFHLDLLASVVVLFKGLWPANDTMNIAKMALEGNHFLDYASYKG